MRQKSDVTRSVIVLLAVTLLLASCSGRSPALSIPADAVLPTDATDGRAIGATRGRFAVTPDGAATYTIPIWTPAGRAGVQPDLALSYNSRAGDGLLGHGWSLQGLSQIARCPKTIAVDGYTAPVRFDDTDALCLDGQRLILVTGTSGDDGAEYRTEHDSFTKIVAHTPDAYGPTSFTAYLKNGRILTYGFNGSDHTPTLQAPRISSTPGPNTFYSSPNIITQNQTVRAVWAIGIAEDRSGNVMRFTYQQATTTPLSNGPPGVAFTLYPLRIDYTGSRSMVEGKPIGPIADGPRSARFVYTMLDDLNGDDFGYLAGLPSWTKQRLSRIELYAPNPSTSALVHSYNFEYRPPTITGRQLLTGVTEKDRAGIALGTTCLDWEQGSTDYLVSTTGVGDISTNAPYRWLETLDLNGDGKSDLLYIPERAITPNYYARLSNGVGFGPPVDTLVTHSTSGHPPFRIDFNNDNHDDLILYVDDFPSAPNGPFIHHPDTPCVARAGNLAGNPGAPSFLLGPCFPGRRVVGGDLNGDGLTDLITYVPKQQASFQYFINQQGTGLGPGVAFSGPMENVNTATGPNKFELDILDVDGDGAQELTGTPNKGDQERHFYELGRAPRSPAMRSYLGTIYTGVYYDFGDFNNDGLVDAVHWGVDENSLTTQFNTGNGFSIESTSVIGQYSVPPNNQIDAGLRLFDYDGDDRVDVLMRSADSFLLGSTQTGLKLPVIGQHVIVMQSNGSGFHNTANWPSQVTSADTGLVQPLDVNGDGLDDLVLYDSGQLLLFQHPGKKPDLLTKITDGFGAVTTVTYDPLSNAAVYSAGTGCAYPINCVQTGLWVVSQHTTSNGNGGVNTWQYGYRDARRDLAGRGLVGMGSQSVTFLATGQKTITNYDLSLATGHTYYPNVGTPSSIIETTPLEAGVTFTRTTRNTFELYPAAATLSLVWRYWKPPISAGGCR